MDFSLSKSVVVLLAVLALGAYDLSRRAQRKSTHLLFACILGTILSLGIIRLSETFTQPGPQDTYLFALTFVFIVLLWKALFGPWGVQTKSIILGTFLFWVALRMFGEADPSERNMRLIATVVALIPASVWCLLFLRYHTERLGVILLMFIAGMLSTAPILFYDQLLRHGIQLNFFAFSIHPESFTRSSDIFVSGRLLGMPGLRTTVFATLVSFFIVAFIEEVSKFWVLRKSGKAFCSSIDDVIQYGIIIAIGFSFAENILNSNYFLGFVRQYLVSVPEPNIAGFLSNVAGRSVLTSMVHIVSTGVLGYFLGLAWFAPSYLLELHRRGGMMPLVSLIRRLLRLPEETVFRSLTMTTGLLCAIILHAAFNFLVTLPDILPGNPRTLGQLFDADPGSPLHMMALLLFPSLFYVCGGFWLLTGLFLRQENQKERGVVRIKEVLVKEEAFG
ncbi:hypothetical protein COU77_01015 [Candidatus Peregrinibacteria bacterium CG10_big_fil_rev_8_21_14_0_10_49_16]|nr:MAG: hypothetical protein COW95_03400 [Candidatus Peregrinibacteria bacterium CG22_combo_CG10-13_8_21_14_all_49_11]PIR52314.1 MAG: hypothetical protein COU77_01015 [Candidatus Peregrinibacteria bacterium CG10_big_fil_rev_8_21_14_0_10_49_16]